MAFVRVARGADIPAGRGQLVEAGAQTLAVFNGGDGRFYAVSALCPHEDGPLADGWIEGDAVVCPWHGFDFDLATGQCRVADELSIGVFPTRVVNGMVEVDVSDQPQRC
jgi:nitrite reductase (NADH) small subunit